MEHVHLQVPYLLADSVPVVTVLLVSWRTLGWT